MSKNILISGWPGAGASTVSILLTSLLNMTLLRGTETFRYIGKELNKSNTGRDRIEIDNYLEPLFGPVFDKYIDYKLVNDENLILEADIGAFRIGKNENYFSIFVMADHETRLGRLSNDGRDLDVDVLKEREEELAKRYKELHGIDWFSMDEIANNYNMILDNSNKSISLEMKEVFEKLNKQKVIESDFADKLADMSDQIESEFWKNGKDFYIKNFKNNNQVMEADDVLREIRELYKDEVNRFPEVLKKVVLSI